MAGKCEELSLLKYLEQFQKLQSWICHGCIVIVFRGRSCVKTYTSVEPISNSLFLFRGIDNRCQKSLLPDDYSRTFLSNHSTIQVSLTLGFSIFSQFLTVCVLALNKVVWKTTSVINRHHVVQSSWEPLRAFLHLPDEIGSKPVFVWELIVWSCCDIFSLIANHFESLSLHKRSGWCWQCIERPSNDKIRIWLFNFPPLIHHVFLS